MPSGILNALGVFECHWRIWRTFAYLEAIRAFKTIRIFKKPFVVSLSNHAFRRKFKTAAIRNIPPRAWFDRLTTNGILDRLTTNGILDKITTNGMHDLQQSEYGPPIAHKDALR